MGCCVSTPKASVQQAKDPRCSPGSDPPNGVGGRLPVLVEEETVKEVLSETPTATKSGSLAVKVEEEKKPSVPKPYCAKPPLQMINDEKLSDTPNPPFLKVEDEIMSCIPKPSLQKIEAEVAMVNSEISEVSEICSVSESVSTTTITEGRDEEEVRRRVDRTPVKFPRNRSFSGEMGRPGRDRGVRKSPVSPARRQEPSPGRARSGLSRQAGQTAGRRDGIRRDLGENSGRRSRSPAKGADVLTSRSRSRSGRGRSPSARRTAQSPGRIPPPAPDNPRKAAESCSGEGKENESLENPLVSLECFIFL
ncbi:uncharacterized protein LOC131154438 [Malania oleifera]|uniref:uncharacterized protein LOC131154438 n=1 Tax=Malania oleifera TaxID=397392 RepID=UPI0025AE1C95|nr:uncharacterized protein LOC131154438 [Malania oleifera]